MAPGQESGIGVYLNLVSMRNLSVLILAFLTTAIALSAEPDWSRGFEVPQGGRANPYLLDDSQLQTSIREGRLHSLHYPVTATGLLLPYEAIGRLISADSTNPLKKLLQTFFSEFAKIKNYDDLEERIGLNKFPSLEGDGVYYVPFRDGANPTHRMGFTLHETKNGKAFTVSCAECHSANLFGRKIIGLTNRFPRANQFFVEGLKAAPNVHSSLFQWSTDASAAEVDMFKTAKQSMSYIEAKMPVQLGLDTSLAQVALSLAKRSQDEWSSRDQKPASRAEPLRKFVADSKPAVWWNAKYKNRWLSDGSIVSGNPIFTNFLWNEIGRGTNLHELDQWLRDNPNVVRDLTTAVFTTEAPHITDFFSAEKFNIDELKRGQATYTQHCSRCHGVYEKAWDLANAGELSASDRLKTTLVRYAPVKPVMNVGTDPQRWQGMKSLEQLNNLAISKINGIVVEPQQGYVPPPLVGIWARWPYFHNNSSPSLCDVLTPAVKRPRGYWAREAIDRQKDFDLACNGYPVDKPALNTPKEFWYDTRREGLRNTGHDEGIFVKDGTVLINPVERHALIKFLQTL